MAVKQCRLHLALFRFCQRRVQLRNPLHDDTPLNRSAFPPAVERAKGISVTVAPEIHLPETGFCSRHHRRDQASSRHKIRVSEGR